MSRYDIFQDRKGVHIKMDKEVHAALRAELFKHAMSMQEIFDEFAKQLVLGNKSAKNILQSLAIRKLREAVNGKVSARQKRKEEMGELDADMLYDLINEDEISSSKENIDT